MTLLLLILDMSGMDYSRSGDSTGLSATGTRLLKSNLLMVRRLLELYDDFNMTGHANPDKWRKHHASVLDLLPEWCRALVTHFLEQKRREGKKHNTVSMCSSSVIRFCQFLLTKGLKSFDAVTPAIVKKFNAQDIKENLQRYKDNSASALSLRDASFIGLGTKMGFRGVNIVNFRLSDIDWKSRSSRLVQEKTGCR